MSGIRTHNVSGDRHGLWFSPYTPVSSTNKTDRHDITGIWLKVVLNTITLAPNPLVGIAFL